MLVLNIDGILILANIHTHAKKSPVEPRELLDFLVYFLLIARGKGYIASILAPPLWREGGATTF
jgi:hypothetical protein